MAKFSKKLGASKGGTSLLVLFMPSVDRDSRPIDQDHWVTSALQFLGTTFGGATAFPKARGVWFDEERNRLVFDEPVVIQCYCPLAAIEQNVERLRAFMVAMGEATQQGAVGLVVDREYIEIAIEENL